jgi:hypothetical protein
MQTKLTLRLDDQLIARAKSYAEQSGKSLSQLVADFFIHLESNTESDELPEKTTALRGCLRQSSFNENVYRDYLEEKYL